jgi:uncharacterized protein with HEPN domain
MKAFAAYRNSGVVSAATSSVSSDTPRGGSAATPLGAATAAVHAARKALALTRKSAIWPTQLAIERLLIRFGEALKSIPNQTLTQIDSQIAWAGPKGFRDIASHWYEEGLDHRLIWQLVNDLPSMVDALQRWIAASDTQPAAPTE